MLLLLPLKPDELLPEVLPPKFEEELKELVLLLDAVALPNPEEGTNPFDPEELGVKDEDDPERLPLWGALPLLLPLLKAGFVGTP